ncbi:MAG: enoyl-CoA hydratase/isomerase family protein [Deltaproteobacteria bacterium]|nr:enoyl-CoA hydratase/isomerase family protein [Deltaproteobacteria bacterium]
MTDGATTLERRGAIATLTLSRPERLNAMGDEVWRGIDAAVVDCEQRRPRALVVTGAAGNFSVGFDLRGDNPLLGEIERSMRERDPAPARGMLRRINMILHRLGRLRCPTIAAIEGFACGGGLELALACDLRVVSRASKLAMRATALGLAPSLGGTVRLTRLVGPARALDLIATSRCFDGEEAFRLGVADRLVEPGTAFDAAIALAQQMERNGPKAVRAATELTRRVPELDDRDAFDRELDRSVKVIVSGQPAEGLAAFREKREARFRDT